MFFGADMMLDVLDKYLCGENPARGRSLIIFRSFSTDIHLKNTTKTRKFKKNVVNADRNPSFTFFNLEKVLIPVHDSAHWTLYVIFPQRKHIVYYDTLNYPEPNSLHPLDVLSYVQDECGIIGLPFRRREWQYYRAEVINQINFLDCGFCIIKYALLVLHDLPMDLKVRSCNLSRY